MGVASGAGRPAVTEGGGRGVADTICRSVVLCTLDTHKEGCWGGRGGSGGRKGEGSWS